MSSSSKSKSQKDLTKILQNSPYHKFLKPSSICKPEDHLRKKNCESPWCVFGLGERKEGIWKDEQKLTKPIAKRKENFPVGLRNLGATCYLNSFLQVLYFNLYVRHAILSFRKGEEATDEMINEVISSLQNLFETLSNGKASIVEPKAFTESLSLTNDLQQDVHEFQELYLDLVGPSLKLTSGTYYPSSSFSSPTSTDPTSTSPLTTPVPSPSSQISFLKLFRGKESHIISCPSCGKSRERLSEFSALTLHLNPHSTDKNPPNSVSEALEQYEHEEELDPTCPLYCEECKLKKEIKNTKSKKSSKDYLDNQFKSIKRTQIRSPPPILTLHLLRYTFIQHRNHMEPKKLNTKIELTPTLNICDKEYQLVAVIYHLGTSALSGHYLVDVYDWKEKCWYHINDENVEKIKENAIFKNSFDNKEPDLEIYNDKENLNEDDIEKKTEDDLEKNSLEIPTLDPNIIEDDEEEEGLDDDDEEYDETSKKKRKKTKSKKSTKKNINKNTKKNIKTEISNSFSSSFNRLNSAYMLYYVEKQFIENSSSLSFLSPQEILDDINLKNDQFEQEWQRYEKTSSSIDLQIEQRKKEYYELFSQIIPNQKFNFKINNGNKEKKKKLSNTKSDDKMDLEETDQDKDTNIESEKELSEEEKEEGEEVKLNEDSNEELIIDTSNIIQKEKKEKYIFSEEIKNDKKLGILYYFLPINSLKTWIQGNDLILSENNGSNSFPVQVEDTSKYLCPHGYILPSTSTSLKVVSRNSYHALLKSFKNLTLTKPLHEKMLSCPTCMSSLSSSQLIGYEELTDLEFAIKFSETNSKKIHEGELSGYVYISKTHYYLIKKYVSRLKKLIQDNSNFHDLENKISLMKGQIFSSKSQQQSEENENESENLDQTSEIDLLEENKKPISRNNSIEDSSIPFSSSKFVLNSLISCEHNKLIPTYARSTLIIPIMCWKKIIKYFPNYIEFKEEEIICNVCIQLNNRLKNLKQVVKNIKSELLSNLSHLNTLRKRKKLFPLTWENPDYWLQNLQLNSSIKYYLISSDWIENWRKFLINNAEDCFPLPLNNSILLCSHNQLVMRIDLYQAFHKLLEFENDSVLTEEPNEIQQTESQNENKNDVDENENIVKKLMKSLTPINSISRTEEHNAQGWSFPLFDIISEEDWQYLKQNFNEKYEETWKIFNQTSKKSPHKTEEFSPLKEIELCFDPNRLKFSLSCPTCEICIGEYRSKYENIKMKVVYLLDQVNLPHLALDNVEAEIPLIDKDSRLPRKRKRSQSKTFYIEVSSSDPISILRWKLYEHFDSFEPSLFNFYTTSGTLLEDNSKTLSDYLVMSDDVLYVVINNTYTIDDTPIDLSLPSKKQKFDNSPNLTHIGFYDTVASSQPQGFNGSILLGTEKTKRNTNPSSTSSLISSITTSSPSPSSSVISISSSNNLAISSKGNEIIKASKEEIIELL